MAMLSVHVGSLGSLRGRADPPGRRLRAGPRVALRPQQRASTKSSAPRTAATWARLQTSAVTLGLSG